MTIYLLVGMIASGKSTYARKRADEGALVVSHDNLTEMLHARYRYEQEKRELYRRMEEALVREALFRRHDVVIDRTHLTRESRERWVDFRRMYLVGYDEECRPEIAIVAVRFPIYPPDVHARRRCEDDPRGRSFEEWLGVAEHHYEQATREPLSEDEGFDRIEIEPGGKIEP